MPCDAAKAFVLQELKHSQADLATAKTDGKNAEQQLAQLSESTLQLQQELQQAQLQVTEVSKQHQHELQALQALLVASQQELQGLQTAQESDQQAFSQQLSQVQANLDASKQSHVESSDKLAQFQSKLRDDSEQQASIDTLQQQHEEALSALRASLADVQHQLDGASQEKASMQQQLASAVGDDAAPIQQGTDQLQAAMAQLETEKQQHISSVKLLTDEVSLLKQELSSRESTPDPMPGDLQQQLDSAKADAAKQASKLAQAEMRASLVRQQLQVLANFHP